MVSLREWALERHRDEDNLERGFWSQSLWILRFCWGLGWRLGLVTIFQTEVSSPWAPETLEGTGCREVVPLKLYPPYRGSFLTLTALSWYHPLRQRPSQPRICILGLPACHLSFLICYWGKHDTHLFVCEKLNDILHMPVPRTYTRYLVSSQEKLVEVVGIILGIAISISLPFSVFLLS